MSALAAAIAYWLGYRASAVLVATCGSFVRYWHGRGNLADDGGWGYQARQQHHQQKRGLFWHPKHSMRLANALTNPIIHANQRIG